MNQEQRRRKAQRLRQQGKKLREIAAALECSLPTVRKLLLPEGEGPRCRECGKLIPNPRQGVRYCHAPCVPPSKRPEYMQEYRKRRQPPGE